MTAPKNWRHYATELWDEIKANDEPYTEQDRHAIDLIADALNTVANAVRADAMRQPPPKEPS